MTEDVPRRTPATEGEAARALEEDGPPPVLTGSRPQELPGFVRDALVEEGRALVSAEAMAGVDEYRPADLTVTVGAGTAMSRLREVLRGEHQWVPLGRTGRGRTAGGVVASAPATPYAGEYGPLRRQVLAVRLVTFGGDPHRWGRAVMKNVAGYDMPRLACGSRGRLGLLTRVTFRVWPRPATRRRFELRPRGDAGGRGDVAAATVGVTAAEDWRPDAEIWRWTAGDAEEPPLVVELAGSEPSVEAREGRLREWARDRRLDVRLSAGAGPSPARPAAAEPASSGGASGTRRAALRIRVSPRYVADAVAALRGADAVRGLTVHPRQGTVVARLGAPGADGEAAGVVRASAAADPDAAVLVDRGRPGMHRRARERRDAGVLRVEERVVEALDGRPRHWAGDFV